MNWKEFEKTKTKSKNQWEFIDGNDLITGRLIGGNLNTITSSYGSKYGLQIQNGDILQIEDSQKTAGEWERNLAFLKLNGIFTKIKALILCKHKLFDDEQTGRTPLDILREIMDKQKLPIIYGADFGHTRPMVIVELNKEITINFKQKKIYQ